MTRTCRCGETKLKGNYHDPYDDMDDPSEDDYCCPDAYWYYNEEEYGSCPYDEDVHNMEKSMCYCTPSKRETCRRDI